jgi:hypothetical protein
MIQEVSNINISAIDKAFQQVLYQRGIHKLVGRSLNSVLRLRYRHRHYGNVSYNTKLFYIRKAGIPMDGYEYTLADLVSLLQFNERTSGMAREFGAAYVIEKWQQSRLGG